MAAVGAGSRVVIHFDVHPRRHFAHVSIHGCCHHALYKYEQRKLVNSENVLDA
jgi:hypothetical protein